MGPPGRILQSCALDKVSVGEQRVTQKDGRGGISIRKI